MAQQKIETYGLESIKGKEWLNSVMKAAPCPQFYIELQGFGRKGGTEDLGGITKEAHAKNFLSAHLPWVFQHWNDWLEMILWGWCNYEEIGAAGCMASGKSYGFSLMCKLEFMAAPLQTACVISSTTKAAIKSRIWQHIKKFRANLFHGDQRFCYPSHLIDSQTLIQATKGDDMHAMTSVAVEGGKLEDAWGNLIGRHPDRMLCFCDEGEQCPEAIFSSRLNMRAGTIFYRFVTAANAVNPSSAYGQFIEPKSGWSSARDSDEHWETRTGICLRFDALKCPNVIAGRRVVPGLVLQQDIDAVRTAKGEDSLEWWAQIRGFPPMSGVRNTVLSWIQIINSKAVDKPVWQGETKWIAALDPAHTTGGDKCILRLARMGHRVDGVMTLGLEPPIHIKLVANGEIDEEHQIAIRVKEELDSKQIKPEDFTMDGTSASGTVSIIKQVWKPGFRVIHFGGAATDRKMPDEAKTAKERCRNRVSEMWFVFAALTRKGQVRGLDAITQQQFCTRKYRVEGERYILQPKSGSGSGFEKGYKEETGKDSPDEGDATVMLADRFVEIAGIDGITSGAKPADQDAWKKATKKHNLQASYCVA